RMLSLACRRLAKQGWATLRFDYFGSGDSGGDDVDFSLAGASIDTRTAIAWMRERSRASLLLAGVRGGAWPAISCADAADRLLLWQPLASGADWLGDLLKADLAERSDRERFPLLPKLPKSAEPDWLLGSHCSAELRNELLFADWPEPPRIPVDLAAHAESILADRWPYARQLTLSPTIAGWVNKIDMQNRNLFGDELWAAVDWIGTSFKARP
ncbi:MAG: hypothetical protein WAV67_00260, partial [Dokdonella sp.]